MDKKIEFGTHMSEVCGVDVRFTRPALICVQKEFIKRRVKMSVACGRVEMDFRNPGESLQRFDSF
jgi:hypothetical protein